MTKPSDRRQLQRTRSDDQHEASNFTLAVVMGAIGAFFIAGIAAAFIYAKDTNPVQHAQAPLPPPAVYAKPETTGSGTEK